MFLFHYQEVCCDLTAYILVTKHRQIERRYLRLFGFGFAMVITQSLHDRAGTHKQNTDVVAINRNGKSFFQTEEL